MKLFSFLKKRKPNIIMILMDGIRVDSLEAAPFYSELKRSAVFSPNMITYAPYTIGSLHSIFSGLYGNTNGVNGYYKSYSFDKERCFTLAQYLKEDGYYTEADVPDLALLPNQGFDKIRVYDKLEKGLLKRQSEIVNQIKDKSPFFLFIRYGEVYTNAVNEVIKKYSDFDEKYFASKEKNFEIYKKWVSQSAEYLRGILNSINELGLNKNSIILIFSDHGCSVGDKPGEKAYGVYLYDYTIRSFLYMIGEDIPKGVEIKGLIRNIDLMPSVMEILKIKEKDGYKKLQGKPFLSVIGGKSDGRIAYSETGGLGGPTPSPEIHNVRAVRTNKWKLIYNDTNKKKEIYDLENDPEEKNNLAGKREQVEKELWEKMMEFEEEFKKNK